jgi:hypothetical protein
MVMTSHEQVSSSFLQGVSCCLETDATDDSGVVAASPNVQATGHTNRPIQFHDMVPV